ncbi:BLUF domain-containing protein [Alteromonas facilis]|uniref:BLUF domain-containing protein n=1 Tax=Alteromonas facilis TaxID=2048004 RepID=UPI000C28566A|nr:BLUF domain-containing protein [Alteromonas facilis]
MFRLVYVSKINQPLFDSTALANILAKAREKNAELNITGMLICNYVHFLQALEGDENAVRDLYTTIAQDPRHTDVVLLSETACEERLFGNWRMGFSSLESSDTQDLSLLCGESALELLLANVK